MSIISGDMSQHRWYAVSSRQVIYMRLGTSANPMIGADLLKES